MWGTQETMCGHKMYVIVMTYFPSLNLPLKHECNNCMSIYVFLFHSALQALIDLGHLRLDPPGLAHPGTGTVKHTIIIYLTALGSKLTGWAEFV